MDKNYTRQELLDKKIPDLKAILKAWNLRTTGNKPELIDRILDNQFVPQSKPKPQLNLEESYLSLLPGDIKRLVNVYQAENEPNNQIFKKLLKEIENGSVIEYRMDNIKIINNWSNINNLNIKLEYKGGWSNPWVFTIENLPPISDEVLADFILLIIKLKIYIGQDPLDAINWLLESHDSKLRIIKIVNQRIYKTDPKIERYDIVYTTPLKSYNKYK